MGRNRNFDPQDVLRDARAVFAERGYEGTSVDMLVSATGVHRGSLYSVFGSKRGLFLECLKQAIETHGADDEIVLVALFDLAPRDAEARQLLAALPELNETAVGARLMRRANINPKE